MRLLILSNIYPPHHIGGYELACQEAVEALRTRGHDVWVLTGTPPYGARPRERGILRELVSDWGAPARSRATLQLVSRERVNQRALRRAIHKCRPEVAQVWNLAGTSASLLLTLARCGVPVLFYVFDEWLVRCWSEDPGLVWRSSLPIAWGKRLAKRAVLCWIDGTCHDVGVFPTLRHALFASEYLRRVHGGTGLEIVGAKVVPWGIDTSRFKDSTGRSGPPRRLLYAGQLVEHKGVHTAVEALQLLRKTHGCSELSLTLVGGAPYPEYEQRLRSTVDAWGLREHVSFLGALPREELPKIYGSHDILLFPSIWQEPFGIVLLEAMAAAMAVVATGTGGSAEIVRHELNALTFPAGDAVSCANRVLRLLREPGLCSKLGEAARRTVTERFPLKRTIDAIEEGALVALRTSVRQPSERLA